jgi:acetyl esterase/lipase
MLAMTLSACDRPLLSAGEVPPTSRTPTERVAYGPEPSQFAEFWRPIGRDDGPPPVVALIHGGCWQKDVASLDIMNPLAAELTTKGFAVWNIEYRRLGEPGGGYPGTFQDIGAALDKLGERGVDLGRLVVVGHSAGGHLALWSSSRPYLPETSPLRTENPVAVPAVLSLGGVGDLEGAAKDPTFTAACGADTIARLVGEGRREGDLYADTSPSRLPATARQIMLHGAREQITPIALGEAYAAGAQAMNKRVEVQSVGGAGHFEVIAPTSDAWSAVFATIEALSRAR